MEALGFLHEKGLPYGHLHTGNILLTQKCAKLLDIENGLLGLPAFYRPYVVQRRKLHATVNSTRTLHFERYKNILIL